MPAVVPTDALPEVLLDILNLHGERRSDQLVDPAIERTGSDLHQTDVLEALLALQRETPPAVQMSRRRTHWKALRSANLIGRESRENAPTDRSSETNQEDVWIPPDTEQAGNETKGGDQTIELENSRWATFRRLCGYYIACLKEDQTPSATFYAKQENQTWVRLLAQPSWGHLDGTTQTAITIPIEAGQTAFVEASMQNKSAYLAYPLELVRPRGEELDPFWNPVFLQPLEFTEQTARRVSLRRAGPVTINSRWLRYARRKEDEKRFFCEIVGLAPPYDPEAEEEDGEGSDVGEILAASAETNPDLRTVARNAAHVLSNKCKEEIDPNSFSLSTDDIKDLPAGIYNRCAIVLVKNEGYTAGLIKDLKKIRRAPDKDLDTTALAPIFGPDCTTPGTAQDTESAAQHVRASDAGENKLNPLQRKALESGRTNPITVVTGPPGTGKSAVVAALVVNQTIDLKTTLFASKNHQALDAVEPKLTQLANGQRLIQRPKGKGSFRTFRWKDFLLRLLESPETANPAGYLALQAENYKLRSELELCLDDMKQWHKLEASLGDLHTEIEAKMKNLPLLWRDESLALQWGGATVKEVKALKNQIARLTKTPTTLWGRLMAWLGAKTRAADLASAHDQISDWPTNGPDGKPASLLPETEEWDEHWDAWEGIAQLATLLTQRTAIETQCKRLPPLAELVSTAEDAHSSAWDTGKTMLEWAALSKHASLNQDQRTALLNLRAAAENFGSTRAERSIRDNWGTFIRQFPSWAVTNLSVSTTLPPIPGGFDLLVLDEASQCDIASVVPLLFRCRRAVIVGDPKQLGHITKLTQDTERQLLQNHNIVKLDLQKYSYRVNSMYALATSAVAEPIFLSRHYRCHPDIAAYASRAFYGNELDVCTAGSNWRVPEGATAGFHWTEVNGPIDNPGRGGANSPGERDAVVAEIKKLRDARFRGTVGIVTPFKRQKELLMDNVFQEVEADLRDLWKLRIGTAHSFQGDERDVILVSLCCGPDMRPGTLSFVTSNENLFNVAITRARAVLHVIGNRIWALENGPHFIQELARSCGRSAQLSTDRENLYESPWEKRLDEALKAAGIATIPQYEIAGRRLDLAVIGPDQHKVDVEVDGEAYHRTSSGDRKPDDYWRDHQLKALGWKVCRFWVYELRENMSECVAKVKAAMEVPDAE